MMKVANRTEDFLLTDPDVVIGREHRGGLDKVTGFEPRCPLAAAKKLCAVGPGHIHEAQDTIHVGFKGERPDFGVRGHRIADPHGLCPGDKAIDECVRNPALHKDARASQTLLAVVGVDAHQGPVESLIDVGALKDDARRFAAELQYTGLQIGAGGGHDRLAPSPIPP